MEWNNLLSPQRGNERKKITLDPARSPFEMDFDRIIFSHPFRRLQDKTQVHPLPEHDFVHTRLTHSLEVSSVGRSLGKTIGKVILERHPSLQKEVSIHDIGGIVAAASLAHDIGNPPFGHSGEDAISDFFSHHPKGKIFKDRLSAKEWGDLIRYEGNAQGFRLLNKKEYQGLKLTYATLAAFSKYPRESILNNPDKDRRSQKKFGFFQAEKEVFTSIAGAVGLSRVSTTDDLCWHRHPLTFLVEAADDICYGIIDLEDGCRLGLVSLEETVELLSAIIKDKFDRDRFNSMGSHEEKIGLLRALSINQLIAECYEYFLDVEERILSASFDSALTDCIPSGSILRRIQEISLKKIYRARKVIETEAVGFEVLPGLLEIITEAVNSKYMEGEYLSKRDESIIRLMPPEIVSSLEKARGNLYQVLMISLDYISNMTDSYAISFYRKLKGIELPKG
ncbi:MAG: deoxyguanosinetriphosphate triphosphohydrolase [Cyclobacteriaceae bacterium]|nr:deoxyguanosinetriphosphate triphosphohydrolase [Cyclobacteriaceae bacterium]